MDGSFYLIRVSASGAFEAMEVSAGAVPQETLCALLQTDVTERLRIAVRPENLDDAAVLCYLIDARGGDKALPANWIGTCFYHTGCPVFGDLLICKCPHAHPEDAVSGFSEAEKNLLLTWLSVQFPFRNDDI